MPDRRVSIQPGALFAEALGTEPCDAAAAAAAAAAKKPGRTNLTPNPNTPTIPARPTTEVGRQVIPFKRIALTDLMVQIPKSCESKTLASALDVSRTCCVDSGSGSGWGGASPNTLVLCKVGVAL